MKNKKIFLSLFLSISIIISSFSGTVPVNANEVMSTDISSAAIDLERSQQSYENKTVDDVFKVPDIIEKDEMESQKYVARVKEKENDLYTFVFANEDGSNTMRVFGHPVKYIDEDGATRDISLEIKENADGRLVSSQHMVDVVFNSD